MNLGTVGTELKREQQKSLKLFLLNKRLESEVPVRDMVILFPFFLRCLCVFYGHPNSVSVNNTETKETENKIDRKLCNYDVSYLFHYISLFPTQSSQDLCS